MAVIDEQEYMTFAYLCEYTQLSKTSINMYLDMGKIPPPDHHHEGHELWLVETIDAWHKDRMDRHKRGSKPRPLNPSARTVTLSGLADIDDTPPVPEPPSPEASAERPRQVPRELAQHIALTLRAAGWFVMTSDVIELAASSDGALPYERQQLRREIMALLPEVPESEYAPG